MRTRAWAAPGQTVQVQIPGRHPSLATRGQPRRRPGVRLACDSGSTLLVCGPESYLESCGRPGSQCGSGFVSDGGQSFRRGAARAAREGSSCYRVAEDSGAAGPVPGALWSSAVSAVVAHAGWDGRWDGPGTSRRPALLSELQRRERAPGLPRRTSVQAGLEPRQGLVLSLKRNKTRSDFLPADPNASAHGQDLWALRQAWPDRCLPKPAP